MTDLTPKARALIDASRKALRATQDDRARIDAALRAKLGAGALPLESSTRWPIAGGVAVGVCVLGAVAYLALPPSGSVPEPRRAQAPVASNPQPMPSAARSEADVVAPTPAVTVPAKSAATPTPLVRDRLGQEVALLSRATSELRAGNAAAALRVLDVHRRKFPNGKLAEENHVARAQALCLLGRVSEGRAELLGLAAGSPALARAEEFCK